MIHPLIARRGGGLMRVFGELHAEAEASLVPEALLDGEPPAVELHDLRGGLVAVTGGTPGDLDQGMDVVATSRPDLVLVAMGAPKQERWIHHNRARLASAVAIGVGASLDFVIGRVRRAPAWVSNAGLEWVYRLVREPRRLSHRYLVKDPRFLAVLARTAKLPIEERVAVRP